MKRLTIRALAAVLAAGQGWGEVSASESGTALVGTGSLANTPLSGASGATTGSIGSPGVSPAVHPLEFGIANIALALEAVGYEHVTDLSIEDATFTATAERENGAVHVRGRRLPSDGAADRTSTGKGIDRADLLTRHGFSQISAVRDHGDGVTAQAVADGKPVTVHLDLKRRLVIASPHVD